MNINSLVFYYLLSLSMVPYNLTAKQVCVKYFKDGILHHYNFQFESNCTIECLKEEIDLEIGLKPKDQLLIGRSGYMLLEPDIRVKHGAVYTLITRGYEQE